MAKIIRSNTKKMQHTKDKTLVNQNRVKRMKKMFGENLEINCEAISCLSGIFCRKKLIPNFKPLLKICRYFAEYYVNNKVIGNLITWLEP